jgi:hypothetical protein
MGLDYSLVLGCLDEIDAQLLAVGKEKCNSLRDKTQLSAVVTLLFRAASLLRSLLGLLERGDLDSYDIVKRSFLEAWLLAFELRLLDSQAKAARWHQEEARSWSPDISKLESYARSQGFNTPGVGRDYGGLSEVAHPTKKAAWSSIRVTTARHQACHDVAGAKVKYEQDEIPALLHSLVWMLDEREGWVALGADTKLLPNAIMYAREYAGRLENLRLERGAEG